jgi:uncharacterized membrane protein YdjX (TVP38/TMEM64 family)
MKDLLKLAAILALAFASTFFIAGWLDLFSEEQVLASLTAMHELDPYLFALIVVGLLWLDLLVAIPTMATILLAGYFLGPVLGAAASIVGLMMMGLSGYGIGRKLGRAALKRFYKDEQRLADIEAAFARNDLLVLFACQALPILPELSCCLAGVARTRPVRFLFGYSVGVVPFAVILAWAGSASTIDDPSPAIFAGIGVTVTLLLIWQALRRRSPALA